MTKYMIFVQDEYEPDKEVPLKKIKREKEAIAFVGDVTNLKKYGCMSLVKETDDGRYKYNEENGEWMLA